MSRVSLSRSAAIFHGQECFGVCGLDGESVELFKVDPCGVVGDES